MVREGLIQISAVCFTPERSSMTHKTAAESLMNLFCLFLFGLSRCEMRRERRGETHLQVSLDVTRPSPLSVGSVVRDAAEGCDSSQCQAN